MSDPAPDATLPPLTAVPPDFGPDLSAIAEVDVAAPADPGWSARTKALEVLAVLATAYTLFFARAILLPFTLALVLALLFRPVVRSLSKRLRLNPYAGAAVVLIGTLLVVGLGLATLAIPAQDFAAGFGEKLDDATDRFRKEPLFAKYLAMQQSMEGGGEGGLFDELTPEELREQAARDAAANGDAADAGGDGAGSEAEPAEEPELTAEEAFAANIGGADAVEQVKGAEGFADPDAVGEDDPVAQTVILEDRPPSLLNQVFSTAPDLLGGVVLAFVFLYFLLAEGDAILNNVLGLLPTVHEKREAVELTRAAEKGVSRYLLAVAIINAGLGVCIGVAMWLVGLPNPVLWGAMAMLLNYIPYVGAFLGAGIVFLAAYLEPEFSLSRAALAPLCYMAINLAEGNFITPAVLGKTIALNPLMVLLSLAFWGWIWGPAGAVLAVPLLSMAKIVCDQFERLHPVGRVLGP